MDDQQIRFLQESIELYERKYRKAVYKHPIKYAIAIYKEELERINENRHRCEALKKKSLK